MEQRNAVILTGFMRQYEDTIDEFKSNLYNDEKKLLEWSQVGTSVPIPKSLEYKKDNELK